MHCVLIICIRTNNNMRRNNDFTDFFVIKLIICESEITEAIYHMLHVSIMFYPERSLNHNMGARRSFHSGG